MTDLSKLRQQFGYSQEQLAREIGVSVKTVWRWEKGLSSPSPLALDKLNVLNPPTQQNNCKTTTQSISQQDINKYYYAYYDSPIDILKLIGNNDGLLAIEFADKKPDKYKNHSQLDQYMHQLDEYFAGKRHNFNVNCLLSGTSFQNQVWRELLSVTYGKTCSYGDIAEAMGNEKAVRAVGNANGKNRIPIIIPCHRIIGANGKLTGYAGGLWRKEWLLEHERKFA